MWVEVRPYGSNRALHALNWMCVKEHTKPSNSLSLPTQAAALINHARQLLTIAALQKQRTNLKIPLRINQSLALGAPNKMR